MSPIVFVLVHVVGLMSLEVSCYSLHHGERRVVKRASSLGCPEAEPLIENINLATPNPDIICILCRYSSQMKTCFEASPDLITPLPHTLNKWFFTDMPHLCGPWKEDAQKVGACIYDNLNKTEEVCSAEPMPNPITLESMINRFATCYAKALSTCYTSCNLEDILYTLTTFRVYCVNPP